MSNTQLPLKRPLSTAYRLSLVIAALMASVSLAGLLATTSLYPTEALRQSFVANDVTNLFIGLPFLLGSLGLARKGSLLGLLLWPGALFYITYNYISYAVAIPLTAQFVVYLALVILSMVAIIGLLSCMDWEAIRGRLAGTVAERFAGGVLAGLGTLFLLRSGMQVVNALSGQVTFKGGELGVLVADLLTIPAWVVGGVLLWRRQALGYVSGAGLLFQGSMLFIGLLVYFILQPMMTDLPFPVTDFVVILGMGLVCFLPFGLYVRGIKKARG